MALVLNSNQTITLLLSDNKKFSVSIRGKNSTVTLSFTDSSASSNGSMGMPCRRLFTLISCKTITSGRWALPRKVTAINFIYFKRMEVNMTEQEELPTKVLTGLYLGSEWTAISMEQLAEFNITHAVNAGITILILNSLPLQGWPRIREHYPSQIKYHNLEFDENSPNFLVDLDECFRFIDTIRNQGKTVLVFCKSGTTKSGTILLLSNLILSNRHHWISNGIKQLASHSILRFSKTTTPNYQTHRSNPSQSLIIRIPPIRQIHLRSTSRKYFYTFPRSTQPRLHNSHRKL